MLNSDQARLTPAGFQQEVSPFHPFVPPLPDFSQRDNNVGGVEPVLAHFRMHSEKSAISLS
jgi:hypothetical protein